MNENHDHLIHRFPPEIASQIFIQYSRYTAFFDKSRDTRSCPLYLGGVCQRWRQLAWATPELWTSLRVALRPHENIEALPQLIAEWLERSATLPLTIECKVGDLEQHLGDEMYPMVINKLNNHSARWHDVHFSLPAHLLRRFCGSLQGNIIRSLVLSDPMRSTWSRPDPSDLPTFSMKCKPSPTRLSLATFPLSSLDISWNFITVASLDDISVDGCIEFLRRSPLLEFLLLNGIKSSSGTFSASTTRISCLHLHSLELANIQDRKLVAEILDSMCLPALQRWIHHHCPVSWEKIMTFTRYSSFCLKEFRISGARYAYEHVHILLQHLSSLEVLQLRFFSQRPNNELLNLLCASPVGVGESPSLPFLPHLQYLEFGPNLPLSWESIPQIFASPLRRSLKMKVDYKHHPDSPRIPDEAAERLLELVEQGVDLTIICDGQTVLDAFALRVKLRHPFPMTRESSLCNVA
ncbi:hypothetical protein M413DRAFT_30816 [Hebeloma cylindrosporum]|uniref:Uncharacterized protein n=1 Tax=Hebeloma cylindrosporum TaxID=76867 RepID=A0A0C3C043_HEBCY|nr:hypothetical protein M413DRAFT_30816 [Hebeloma cylindrosporum h7]